MKYLPYSTLEERLVVYNKILTIYRYMHDNNTNRIPIKLVNEAIASNWPGPTAVITGFCECIYFLCKELELHAFPELMKYRPEKCFMFWFPIEDYISRINILEKVLAEHDNTTTNTELIMDK